MSAGTIQVDVDRTGIDAELAAVTAEAGDIAPLPTAEAAQPPAPEVMPAVRSQEIAPMLSTVLFESAATFAPNWEISKGETDRVGAALADVLAYWFPNTEAIDPKYMALFSLGMAGWAVVALRRDERGAFRPLRKPVRQVEQADTRAAPPVAPAPARAPLQL